jgi:hypothetical protein
VARVCPLYVASQPESEFEPLDASDGVHGASSLRSPAPDPNGQSCEIAGGINEWFRSLRDPSGRGWRTVLSVRKHVIAHGTPAVDQVLFFDAAGRRTARAVMYMQMGGAIRDRLPKRDMTF